MATTYTPLVLPTIANASSTSGPNFATTATFLADSAKSLVASGNSFIQGLVDAKNTDFFSIGNLPSFFAPIFYSGAIGSEAFKRPTRPDMNLPSLKHLFDRLQNLVLPSPPASAFTYTDPGYQSALNNPLVSKLLADLLGGGYGIDNNDETNLWNRERDREAALMLSNIEEAKRDAASTGFVMPQGALTFQIQKARQEYVNKVSSVNRDIGLKRADMFVEQRRKVIEQVLSTEALNMALYNAVQGRALEIARTQIMMTLALYEAGIKYIELQIEAVTKQVVAQMEFYRTQATVYNADIAMYSAYVNALIGDGRLYSETQRNTLDRDKTILFASAEQVRFRLQQLAMGVDNSKDINKFGAEFFRTALGASMNGISGLAVQTTTV